MNLELEALIPWLIAVAIVWLIIAVTFGWLTAYAAAQKGLNKETWFWLGAFFQVAGLLALIAVPGRRELERSASNKAEQVNDMAVQMLVESYRKEHPTRAKTDALDQP